MVAAMEHEPFYTSGGCIEPRLNIRLGWVVQAGSSCDCLPVVSERGDVVMAFYGEDFPQRSLIRLYEEHGESFLRQLNGWFAGVLIDLNRRKVLLFNDRTGEWERNSAL